MSETWNTAILDCGASKTVCGKVWINAFLESLPSGLQESLKNSESNSYYKFGTGQAIKAIYSINIPVTIAQQDMMLQTDVIDEDIPLLLSRDSMKKANMLLNFENDSATVFGRHIGLIITKSGHYAIPLTTQCHASGGHRFFCDP